MGEYTRIPADTFEQIQTDAGILLYKFARRTLGL